MQEENVFFSINEYGKMTDEENILNLSLTLAILAYIIHTNDIWRYFDECKKKMCFFQ